jgi:hypothetical protein
MARKTRLTPALHQAIVTAVAGGVPYYQACLLAGVKVSTATDWLERGESRHPHRPPTPALVAFAADIARAKAIDEARRLARLEQAGRGGAVVHEKVTTFADGRAVTERTYAPPDWRCDTWYLERAFPDRWGRRVQADLSLEIRQLAQEVAEEIGVPVDELIAEAQAFLREHDARHRR